MYQKTIEVNGKKYTLTANRSIIKTIAKIEPALLQIKPNNENDGNVNEVMAGIEIISNLDILFYDLIKVVHKEISKEKSDEILNKLDEECGLTTVSNELIDFALSSFTQGEQIEKKSIWAN